MKLVELKSAANNLNDKTEYKRLKAIVQREARKDKDMYWEEKCNTINDLFKKNSNNTMNEIKKLTKHSTNKPGSYCMRNRTFAIDGRSMSLNCTQRLAI